MITSKPLKIKYIIQWNTKENSYMEIAFDGCDNKLTIINKDLALKVVEFLSNENRNNLFVVNYINDDRFIPILVDITLAN